MEKKSFRRNILIENHFLNSNMENLEYRIGELNINSYNSLGCVNCNVREGKHKFVVEALEDNSLSIYFAEVYRIRHVVKRFNLSGDKIVGGGHCYLDGQQQLVMDSSSVQYHSLPTEVVQRFAELVVPELKKMGRTVSGIIVKTEEEDLHPFWKK